LQIVPTSLTLDLMKTPTAQTPMAFARAIVLGYKKYGKMPGKALRHAQIAPSQLRHADARITAAQMEALSGAAMKELNDEALGWFSRPLPWGSNGMLCRASLASANLQIALQRWCRHYALLIDDIRLELSIEGAVARLAVIEQRDLGEFREFCLVSCLRNLHGFACWLTDSGIPLTEATFPFDAPPHSKAYGLMFRGPSYFNAAHASICFDAQYLALPVRRDDRALRNMLQRPLPLIVLQYRRDRLLSRRVRELLSTRAAELSNAQALATVLNISMRGLYRHLASEGTSWQTLKDEARRDHAVDQLRHTTKAIKQIATSVGFRSEASFSRAFRQWTGQPPVEFRHAPSTPDGARLPR
jgi:AraC-like DNA-binding protein